MPRYLVFRYHDPQNHHRYLHLHRSGEQKWEEEALDGGRRASEIAMELQ